MPKYMRSKLPNNISFIFINVHIFHNGHKMVAKRHHYITRWPFPF